MHSIASVNVVDDFMHFVNTSSSPSTSVAREQHLQSIANKCQTEANALTGNVDSLQLQQTAAGTTNSDDHPINALSMLASYGSVLTTSSTSVSLVAHGEDHKCGPNEKDAAQTVGIVSHRSAPAPAHRGTIDWCDASVVAPLVSIIQKHGARVRDGNCGRLPSQWHNVAAELAATMPEFANGLNINHIHRDYKQWCASNQSLCRSDTTNTRVAVSSATAAARHNTKWTECSLLKLFQLGRKHLVHQHTSLGVLTKWRLVANEFYAKHHHGNSAHTASCRLYQVYCNHCRKVDAKFAPTVGVPAPSHASLVETLLYEMIVEGYALWYYPASHAKQADWQSDNDADASRICNVNTRNVNQDYPSLTLRQTCERTITGSLTADDEEELRNGVMEPTEDGWIDNVGACNSIGTERMWNAGSQAILANNSSGGEEGASSEEESPSCTMKRHQLVAKQDAIFAQASKLVALLDLRQVKLRRKQTQLALLEAEVRCCKIQNSLQ